jgi:hypothetical protein
MFQEQMSAKVAGLLRQQWEANYVANRDRIKATEEFQYRATNKHKPVLCVGAGPSLRENLRHIDDSLYKIIACDKAVPALVRKGVTIDYIVAMNAAPTAVREWLEPANDGYPTLIVPCGVNPEAYQDWKGKLQFVNAVTSTGLHDRVTSELGLLPMVIGSNAGAFSYCMAWYMGFNPIAYCAMDFCFERKMDILRSIEDSNYNILEMNDVRRRKRWLTLGWFFMADAFQDRVKAANHQGVRTVNCTEGGINYSNYTERLSLVEYGRKLKEGWLRRAPMI